MVGGVELADDMGADETGRTGDENGERFGIHAPGVGVNSVHPTPRLPQILLAAQGRLFQATPMNRIAITCYPRGVAPARAGAHASCAQVFSEGFA